MPTMARRYGSPGIAVFGFVLLCVVGSPWLLRILMRSDHSPPDVSHSNRSQSSLSDSKTVYRNHKVEHDDYALAHKISGKVFVRGHKSLRVREEAMKLANALAKLRKERRATQRVKKSTVLRRAKLIAKLKVLKEQARRRRAAMRKQKLKAKLAKEQKALDIAEEEAKRVLGRKKKLATEIAKERQQLNKVVNEARNAAAKRRKLTAKLKALAKKEANNEALAEKMLAKKLKALARKERRVAKRKKKCAGLRRAKLIAKLKALKKQAQVRRAEKIKQKLKAKLAEEQKALTIAEEEVKLTLGRKKKLAAEIAKERQQFKKVKSDAKKAAAKRRKLTAKQKALAKKQAIKEASAKKMLAAKLKNLEKRKELGLRRKLHLVHAKKKEMMKMRSTLKRHGFQYKTKYPPFCSCEVELPNPYSVCYRYTLRPYCVRHKCRAKHVCVPRDTGLLCIRKRTTTKVVPYGYSGECKTKQIPGYMYTVYSVIPHGNPLIRTSRVELEEHHTVDRSIYVK